TVSISVVAGVSSGKTVSDILRMADEALYQAKHSGRNRCVAYRPGRRAPFRRAASANVL
ncbi:MAG: diguanylate cyclase domain-containing protein, partial [Chromatocurvus sp.]